MTLNSAKIYRGVDEVADQETRRSEFALRQIANSAQFAPGNSLGNQSTAWLCASVREDGLVITLIMNKLRQSIFTQFKSQEAAITTRQGEWTGGR